MPAPLDQPMVCPTLIGRTHSLALLLQIAQRAWEGRGQTALISGEAGIGKSRLVAELRGCLTAHRGQAASLSPLVLQGRCFEPDHTLPYAPLLDLLRAFFATRPPDDIAQMLGANAGELVKLLPELAGLLPALISGPSLDPEAEKRRLHHALGEFFRRLASDRPLLLVVEDVHWSDETSLELLLYLARHMEDQPILLVLTYRIEDVQPRLERFLAELERDRLAREIPLGQLGREDIGAMVRTILGLSHPVRADAVKALHALTDGNPFFLEEVLKSLPAAGAILAEEGRWDRRALDDLRIPRTVQVAVQRRSDQLTPGARHLLVLAAVAGRRFDFALLQELTRQEEATLLGQVKELMAAQFVVEESAEIFAFRHALTREAVYADLLARERRALHRVICEALERVYADGRDAHLADLAYHAYQAAAWAKVLEYAPRAGRHALALFAPRAAIEQFTRALEAARQLSLPSPAELHRARAHAHELLGDFDGALADYLQTLEAARDRCDARAEWQSLLDLGALWTAREYQRAGDYFHQALALARTLDDPATLAHSLNRVGNWHVNAGRLAEGQRSHEEALAIFERLHDRRGLAETLDLLATTRLNTGDFLQSTAYYQRALALFRELGDRQRQASSLVMLAPRGAHYLGEAAIWTETDLATCVGEAEEALALMRRIGWRAGEALALVMLALALSSRGAYGRALALAHESLDLATELGHSPWMALAHLTLGAIHLDLLVLSDARVHLERAWALIDECGYWFWRPFAAGFLASTLLLQGNTAEAAAVLDGMPTPDRPEPGSGRQPEWCARAELALARRDPARALATVDLAFAAAPNSATHAIHDVPRLAALRGAALMAQGRQDEAAATLRAALDTARRRGAPAQAWRIHAALARLYQQQGWRAEAAREAAAARTIIGELAATVGDAALKEEFLRRAGAVLPRLPALTPRRAAKQAFDGLTEREREVAALIAQGKSNRGLAAALVVSERTVEKHIENIMAKLGVDARAQIAVWAVEMGLVRKADR